MIVYKNTLSEASEIVKVCIKYEAAARMHGTYASVSYLPCDKAGTKVEEVHNENKHLLWIIQRCDQ